MKDVRRFPVCVAAAAAMVAALAVALAAAFVPSRAVKADIGSCASYAGLPGGGGKTDGMVFVPGGAFRMGSERHRPEERFSHAVTVDGFWIDRHEVTNAQFAAFVAATGHVTAAERAPDAALHPNVPGHLLVAGSVVFVPPLDTRRGGDLTQWWQFVPGANWRNPEGKGSSIKGRENHPVVHVAFDDALAYARWRGRELPTEAQWEYAARGGALGKDEWDNPLDGDGKPRANTWQGVFPVVNTKEDGYAGTAPVGCYRPNELGLYDMIGNVWELTGDWYAPGHPRETATNPRGPNLEALRPVSGQPPSKVIKGGSYLCAANFCSRYRPSARQPQEADLGTAHVGFRTVLTRIQP